jgi:hypothetical protein
MLGAGNPTLKEPVCIFGVLLQSLEWREQWQADTMLQEFRPPEVLRRYFCGGICGYDKEGYPIFIEPAGNLDMKGEYIFLAHLFHVINAG